MRRAYAIFNSNGGAFGKELADRLQAERQLVWKSPIELQEEKDILIKAELNKH
jgi:hypothetical protein